MAISKEAETVKNEMMATVTMRRELVALEEEWRGLLDVLEDADEGSFALAEAVNRERMALRRTLTVQQLRNWARIQAGGLSPLQGRILGLRFVQGCTWSDITARLKKAKQYLLREHNKALETLARQACNRREKSL